MAKTLLLAAAALALLATSSPVAVAAIKDIATLNKPSPDTDVLKAPWIAKFIFLREASASRPISTERAGSE